MTALLYSPADILAQLLVDGGHAGDPEASPLPAWPAYVNSEPDAPEELLTVYDRDPRVDARDMTTGEHALHHAFEIRLRSGDRPALYRRAEALRVWLETSVSYARVDLADASYLVPCVAETVLRGLGRDVPGSKRFRYAVTGVLTVEPCG